MRTRMGRLGSWYTDNEVGSCILDHDVFDDLRDALRPVECDTFKTFAQMDIARNYRGTMEAIF